MYKKAILQGLVKLAKEELSDEEKKYLRRSIKTRNLNRKLSRILLPLTLGGFGGLSGAVLGPNKIVGGLAGGGLGVLGGIGLSKLNDKIEDSLGLNMWESNV